METLNVTNATTKFTPTTEGIIITDLNLLFMAVISIYIGAKLSVKYHKSQKDSGEPGDFITHKDALMFPITASATLLGLYIFFKVFSKEYINLLVAFYFFLLGVIALAHVKSCLIRQIYNYDKYKFCLTLNGCEKSEQNDKEEEIDQQNKEKHDKGIKEFFKMDFDYIDIFSIATSLCIGVWYVMKKHWFANNLFGVAFAINAIEMLQLNKITTGLILLGGLFIYDIFWVFGTNVMVSVAKSFDAPIKLMFPLDILENGFFAKNFGMLGLGDIVIPGIFLALILRFETGLKRRNNYYFNATLMAYTAGLIFTTLILHFFKHAQPALLYLVPACVGTPFILSYLKGDLTNLLNYEDSPAPPTQPASESVPGDKAIKAD